MGARACPPSFLVLLVRRLRFLIGRHQKHQRWRLTCAREPGIKDLQRNRLSLGLVLGPGAGQCGVGDLDPDSRITNALILAARGRRSVCPFVRLSVCPSGSLALWLSCWRWRRSTGVMWITRHPRAKASGGAHIIIGPTWRRPHLNVRTRPSMRDGRRQFQGAPLVWIGANCKMIGSDFAHWRP